MVELLSAAQMRAAEHEAIAAGHVSGLELMERAGQGVVEAIFERWPALSAAPARALVLCGPGNNGGDGFVIARLLHERGWRVDVFMLGAPERLPRDARSTHARWQALGAVHPLSDTAIEGYIEDHPDTKLAIDALFGTGLTRPFSSFGGVRKTLNAWQASAARGGAAQVVAVDLPSGVCADSGRYLGYAGDTAFDLCALANLTVTFHRRKRGHVLAAGGIGAGDVVVKDIGLSPQSASPDVVQEVALTQAQRRALGKSVLSHKFSNGAALVLSGGAGKSGAARLAARACLRIGAGVVRLGVPRSAFSEVAAQITGLMMDQIETSGELEAALTDPRLRALCLGPGLGQDRARDLLEGAVRAKHAPYMVLDADALSAFADDPGALFEGLGAHCVMTPHMGEFNRLFPDLAARLRGLAQTGPAFSKVDAAREAARRAGCILLLKGRDTVIAAPNGRCAVHSALGGRAAPWLASAGSGDVLAGFITGLLARGFPSFEAASIAAYLHVDCALRFGPGLIAEDLPETLPQVLATLLQED